MSQKKNQPGCPCCDSPPTECCDDETPPTVTIAGYTGQGITWSPQECCWRQSYTPNELVPAHECCIEVCEYEIRTDCTTDLYAFETVNFPTTTFPNCPFPQNICCLDGPVKIATFVTSEIDRQTNVFAVKFYIESINIQWGKEVLECPAGTEPSCRWYMIATFNCRFDAAVNSSMYGAYTLENTFLHECFYWTGSPVNDSGYNCSPEEACEQVPNQIFESCSDTRPILCDSSDTQYFCVQRIRYFNVRPEGTLTFTSSNVINDCQAPTCDYYTYCGGVQEGGFDQTVCVESPDTIKAPYYCIDPPTISSVTTNYVMDQSQCPWVNYIDSECLTNQVACLPTGSCSSPITVSVTCESLDYDYIQYTLDPDCRFRTYMPGNYEYCGCLAVAEANGPSFNVAQVPSNSCADASDCYTRILCGGEVVSCVFNFSSWRMASNDLTVTITCGTYTPAECCFTPATLEISVEYD